MHRLVNISHHHGFVYAMMTATFYNLVFVPLGGWFQTNVVEGFLGWDMYEFKMRRLGRGPRCVSLLKVMIFY